MEQKPAAPTPTTDPPLREEVGKGSESAEQPAKEASAPARPGAVHILRVTLLVVLILLAVVIGFVSISIAGQLHYNGCVTAASDRFQGAAGLEAIARKQSIDACTHTLF